MEAYSEIQEAKIDLCGARFNAGKIEILREKRTRN
jgi:hypothetical protein